MEDKFPQEQPSLNPEIPSDALDSLHERLGFIETDELAAIRNHAIEASQAGDSESVEVLVLEYQLQGEKVVSDLEGSEYMRGQIGLIVATAALHRDTGDFEAFLSDVADAKEYALNAYEDEVVAELEKIPSAETTRALDKK